MKNPKELYAEAGMAVKELKKDSKLADFDPKIAITLGSGCGGIAKNIEVINKIPYGEVHGMPVSTVEGHEGALIAGRYHGKEVLAFSGRNHYYEGNSAQQASYMMYIAKHFGAEVAIMTAAAGIAPELDSPGGQRTYLASVGDILLITSYYPNLLPSSLRGETSEKIGPRFNGTINCPSIPLKALTRAVAEKSGISLKDAIYVPRQGPNYETPVEIELLSALSTLKDLPVAGGMSTVPELEAANMLGVDSLSLIVVTNRCFNMEDLRSLEKSLPITLLDDKCNSLYTLDDLRGRVMESLGSYQPCHEEVAANANTGDVNEKLEGIIGGTVKALRF